MKKEGKHPYNCLAQIAHACTFAVVITTLISRDISFECGTATIYYNFVIESGLVHSEDPKHPVWRQSVSVGKTT